MYSFTHHITSYHIISYHIISYHIISHHLISHHIISPPLPSHHPQLLRDLLTTSVTDHLVWRGALNVVSLFTTINGNQYPRERPLPPGVLNAFLRCINFTADLALPYKLISTLIGEMYLPFSKCNYTY